LAVGVGAEMTFDEWFNKKHRIIQDTVDDKMICNIAWYAALEEAAKIAEAQPFTDLMLPTDVAIEIAAAIRKGE
jgi:hypothetical protein